MESWRVAEAEMAEKIAYFDMFSGISGDMALGSFVDLGVPVVWLNRQFEMMPLPEADIRVEDIWHNGIKGVNLFVEEKSGSTTCHQDGHLGSDSYSDKAHSGTYHHHCLNHHEHSENHHNHPEADHDEHASSNKRQSEHHSHSRNYAQIREMISTSPFSEYVKSSSLKAFEKIAIAESEIHGTEIEKVHFHEVGGMDAIVDIVGTFLCIEYLGITKIYGSPPPVGRGSVRCSHGTIPLPAPATMKILKGVPVRGSNCDMELITPTGAAIITTLTDKFGDIPDMVIGDTGYGSGKRRSLTGLPNLLRIITGEPLSLDAGQENSNKERGNLHIFKESVYVLETAIDDMNPEIAGYIMEKLFSKGALDVSYSPLQMKKNRPAFKLEVICRKEQLDLFIELILTESTSAGLRFYSVERAVLARETLSVKSPFGTIEAKKITDPRGAVRIVPEYEVCRKIALEQNIPLQEIYSGIVQDGSYSR